MRCALIFLCGVVLWLVTASGLAAQAPPAPPEGGGELIQLSFPESVEIEVLVEYVSKRLNLNIFYCSDALAKKRVTISSPAQVPKESLLTLLESVLQMSGFALMEGDQPGWKKIIPTQNLLGVAEGVQRDERQLASAPATTVLTQVFELRNVAVATAERAIRPFLSKPGGNAFPVQNTDLLIVSDYVGSLRPIATLVELLDRPGRKSSIRFIPIKHLSASDLASQITTLLGERDKIAFGEAEPPARGISLSADPRTNQIAVISLEGEDTEVVELIKELDVPEPTPTVSNVRFYKLVNTTAAAVLETLRALEADTEGEAELGPAPGGSPLPETPAAPEPSAGAPAQPLPREPFTGRNRPPRALAAAEPPPPPAYRRSTPPGQKPGKAASAAGKSALRTRDATITADPNTNSIIIIAPPATQRTYKELIDILDKRRPQVMVEVTLVTLGSTDAESLGVELSRVCQSGDDCPLLASLFGLSDIDPTTGQLTLEPGLGFNGALVGPDSFNAVVRALATHTGAKIVSAPKILVNDNATATLSSVAEAPFTSINASDTVSTTSFAGYATAGTEITVTPHISEGDHLQLQYSVTLNSFAGEGSLGIPPARQTNAINSEVTVPDGYAVVVGGLMNTSDSESVAKVPILGDLPWVKYLFRSTTASGAKSRLFVFIRPVILRDDQFAELKYLSDRDLEAATMPPNYPRSEPLVTP